MIRTRLLLLGAIALIAAMIFDCGVAVAEPNQTSADYVMPGCRDAASLITFSNVGESAEEAYRTGCSWPQLHGSASDYMYAHGHDCSAGDQYRRSVHRRTARENSRGLQPLCR
jgi:hypothetical protein